MGQIRITQPVIITPRLLPGVRVGDGFVSVQRHARRQPDGRFVFSYFIDFRGGEHSGDDLTSPRPDLQEALATTLTFLSAASENEELFPADVTEWASAHSDELSLLASELDEGDGLIEESYEANASQPVYVPPPVQRESAKQERALQDAEVEEHMINYLKAEGPRGTPLSMHRAELAARRARYKDAYRIAFGEEPSPDMVPNASVAAPAPLKANERVRAKWPRGMSSEGQPVSGTVYDAATRMALDGEPSARLMQRSWERGGKALHAFLDNFGIWQYTPEHLVEHHRTQWGVDVRLVLVRSPAAMRGPNMQPVQDAPGVSVGRGPLGEFLVHETIYEPNGVKWDAFNALSAYLFVGLNVGGKPKWDPIDVVRAVRTVLRRMLGRPEDSSFIVQTGVYTHAKKEGEPATAPRDVVQERSVQVIVFDGDPPSEPKKFIEDMQTLGQSLAERFEQETVIVDVRRANVSIGTFGMEP